MAQQIKQKIQEGTEAKKVKSGKQLLITMGSIIDAWLAFNATNENHSDNYDKRVICSINMLKMYYNFNNDYRTFNKDSFDNYIAFRRQAKPDLSMKTIHQDFNVLHAALDEDTRRIIYFISISIIMFL